MKKGGLNLPKEKTFTGPALIWKRALAFLADLLIINLIIFFPFKKIIGNIIPEFASYSEAYNFLANNQAYITALTLISIVMSLLALLYFALLEFKTQQTPGKMLFNISIISDTKKLAFWQCIVNNLFIIPLFPFVLLWVIDPLFLIFTKSNQRLSEIISKIKTVQKYTIG